MIKISTNHIDIFGREMYSLYIKQCVKKKKQFQLMMNLTFDKKYSEL